MFSLCMVGYAPGLGTILPRTTGGHPIAKNVPHQVELSSERELAALEICGRTARFLMHSHGHEELEELLRDSI